MLLALLRMATTVAEQDALVGHLRILVLDEADRLLEMGFEAQLTEIVSALPSTQRQTLFFSATWPAAVRTVAAQLLRPGALRLRLGASEGAEAVEQGGLGGLRVNPSIRQAVEVLRPDEKEPKLR